MLKYALVLLALAFAGAHAQTYESRALEISKDIQQRHIPFGTVLNPMYVSPASTELQTYTRCGDSAIWTGHWLAAESFRYAVTRSAEALEAARLAFRGVRSLVEVTGDHSLVARCVLDPSSPYAAGPRNEERSHGEFQGVFEGRPYVWIGGTSRDQYMGVFFGLSAAYEHVPELRPAISPVATALIDRLLAKNWSVVMPDGDVSTVFWLRPDQTLAILQVGRQVNPAKFAATYADRRSSLGGLDLIMAFEARDVHDSYFKFNLAAITWFNLLRLEEPDSSKRASYLDAYRTFRRAVAGHGNAFFNVIDRAVQGPDPRRDSETVDLLAEWLLRPRRGDYVDLRGKYKACGDDRACDPIPVAERVRTDFLWQRSPFLLYGGGGGLIEGAGIDFTLPYWMGRYYGVDAELTAVSAASGAGLLAPSSIATLYGAGFVPGSAVQVEGVTARVFFSGASQINFLVPDETQPGARRVRVLRPDGTQSHTTVVEVARTAPALFSAAANGKGIAAAVAIQNGAQVPVFRCSGPLLCVAQPLEPREGRPVYVSLFGTGIRYASAPVTATFEGEPVPVLYAGPQNEFPGLDQINIRLDSSLRTRGERNLYITVDGKAANAVQVLVR